MTWQPLYRQYTLVNTAERDRNTLKRALYDHSRVIAEEVVPDGLYKGSLISIVETTATDEAHALYLSRYQAERLRSFLFGVRCYDSEGAAMDAADVEFGAFPEPVHEKNAAEQRHDAAVYLADEFGNDVSEWDA
jgi:hypothetical protein